MEASRILMEASRILMKKFKLPFREINGIRWINTNNFKQSVIIDQKYYKLIDEELENDKIMKEIGTKFYIKELAMENIIKKLKLYPEHYNAHQIYDLNIKFSKQQETETLAIIYAHYRNKYNMHYQHPELDFRMDTNMVIEVGHQYGVWLLKLMKIIMENMIKRDMTIGKKY